MKQYLLLIFSLILSLNCYAQISFEQGYFIDNSNQKINGFIKNVDWKNNPTKFEYKLSENDETKVGSLESVKEFGINNTLKYVRSKVNIDRSSENLNYLDNHKEPSSSQEEIFLKVLIEGNASLYEYIDGNLRRYFYSMEDAEINPLTYKIYRLIQVKLGKTMLFSNNYGMI